MPNSKRKKYNENIDKRLSFLYFAYKKGKLDLDTLDKDLADKIKELDNNDSEDVPLTTENIIIKIQDYCSI